MFSKYLQPDGNRAKLIKKLYSFIWLRVPVCKLYHIVVTARGFTLYLVPV